LRRSESGGQTAAEPSSALGGSAFDLAARGATCYVGRGKIGA